MNMVTAKFKMLYKRKASSNDAMTQQDITALCC